MARAIAFALLLFTCTENTPPDAGRTLDGGGPTDAGLPDGSTTDAGPPLSCAEQLMTRQIALDVDGPRTQIHPAVLFDGEAIWVAYNRPDATGNFDVYATRRGCDGAVLVEPFLVQATPDGNDVDPAIARSGDTLLIAWVADDGMGGTDNLQVRYRTFDLEGRPQTTDDGQLTTSRMGTPITDNHLGVELAVDAAGDFVAAGARAVPEAMRFQAYAQTIGPDGALSGEAREAELEAMITQRGAAVDVAADGTTWLVYDREPDMGTPELRVAALGSGAPELPIEGLTQSSGGDVLAHDGAVWVAFSGAAGAETDLRLVDVTAPLAARTMRDIGEAGRVEHSPRLAVGEGTVAVAFMRQIRGFTNEILLASVTDPTIAPIPVSPESPAYQPALTHVLGDWWFVAYAIGDSPDFRLAGRFVELTAP